MPEAENVSSNLNGNFEPRNSGMRQNQMRAVCSFVYATYEDMNMMLGFKCRTWKYKMNEE